MRIQVKELTYKYMIGTKFEQTAVDGISAEINSGEFVGLIGHTGSGKSTFMQLLNGLLMPTSGEVLLDGENIHLDKKRRYELRQKVGFVFQYPEHQLFESTILKDVSYGPGNLGLPEEEIINRAEEALLLVDIDRELFNKSPFELSGGQKRRVAIAGVLAMKPEVLILDEPAAGLDPKGRNHIFNLIKEMHRKLGLTIILVSHSMEVIASLSDKIIVMHGGKIALNGTPGMVFQDSEKLESMGLSIPTTTKIIRKLNEKGFKLNPELFDVNDVAKTIYESIKDRASS